MINVGDTVEIVKGCRAYNVSKGGVFRVVFVRENGADYSHTVSVGLEHSDGWVTTFQARHKNRLNDAEVNAHKGDPTRNIRFRRTA